MINISENRITISWVPIIIQFLMVTYLIKPEMYMDSNVITNTSYIVNEVECIKYFAHKCLSGDTAPILLGLKTYQESPSFSREFINHKIRALLVFLILILYMVNFLI